MTCQADMQEMCRLVSAFESLATREALLIAAGSWDEAAAVKERLETLTGDLTRIAFGFGSDELIRRGLPARIGRLVEGQKTALGHYATRKRAVQAELAKTNQANSLVRTVRPAYCLPENPGEHRGTVALRSQA